MLGNLMKYLICSDNIKEIVIKGKEIIGKDLSQSLCVFANLKNKIFNDKHFGLKEIGQMNKIIQECNFENFNEGDDEIEFIKNKTKYNKKKTEATLIGIPNMTKKELENIFTENKIDIVLSSELIENIRKVIGYGINDFVRFFTRDNKMFIMSGDNYQDRVEIELFETEKKIDNYYEGKLLLSVLNIIDEKNKFIIDYNIDEKMSMPLSISFDNEIGEFFYLIIPVERKM